MSASVLVSSVTGTTLTVARAIADALGATLTELAAPKVQPRPWSVLSLGYATLFGGTTPVTLSGPDPTRADLIVLAAPVWAGRLSVPMRSWLGGHPALPQRVALVMTGDNPIGNPGALPDFARQVGVSPVATLYLCSTRVKQGGLDPEVTEFCRALGHSPLL